MFSEKLPTAVQVSLIAVEDQHPPKASKLLLLSKWGVLSLGTYQEGFHVAWAPLPKVPEKLKKLTSIQV